MPVLDEDLDVVIADRGACMQCQKNPPAPGSSYCVPCAVGAGAEIDTSDVEAMAKREMANRELCRRRIIPLTLRLKPDYLAGWFHRDLAARLERFVRAVEQKRSPRMIINVPPRHGKSELASKIMIAQALGRNPQWHITAATHSEPLALDNSRDVLAYVRSPKFRAVFPELELAKEAQGAMGWRTTQGGRYKPAGVGGGIAGYGGHILLVDDPHKDEEAYSQAVRDRIWRWWKGSASPRVMPGGGRLIIQTRWVMDDLTGRVIEEEGRIEDGGLWEVVCYPCEAVQDEYRLSNGHIVDLPSEGSTFLRRKGEYLHPERYPESEMATHKRDPVIWQALYQQNPTAGSAALFHEGGFRKVSLRDIPSSGLTYYSAWDLAVSTAQRSDYTVRITGGVDAEDNLWIVDLYRGKQDSFRLMEMLVESYLKWKDDLIGIEKSHLAVAVSPFLEKYLEEQHINDFPLVELDHGNKDKIARARPIQMRISQGKVRVPADAPWYAEFMKELTEFPGSRHDDQVDALAWLGHMLKFMVKPREAPQEQAAQKHPPSVPWRQRLGMGGSTTRDWRAA
jgi:predicted phage terminase large subunit-like protein